mgnify:FL=1|tara:strand:- start:1080 stop:1421 length:342 start_codon:yes stop_codon:yes gene_type:complete
MARKMLKAGQLRNKVTVQVNTDTRDAFGGVVNSWATRFSSFASIDPTSGSERLGSDKITADRSYEIVMRVNPSLSVSPQHRISWDSRLFDIESVSNFEEKGHFLKITAIEREV